MSVVNKNIYDLLGNTEEEPPAPPVNPVDKATTYSSKRNTDGLAPSRGPVTAGNRRGGANVSGNEAAFRDRNAGRDTNRGKPTDEAQRGGRRGGLRGGRGGRREEGDRHPTRGAPHSNSEKQAAQSWGANEGNAELKDEQAAAEIAQSEQKAEGEAAAEGDAREEEAEDKHISYDQYLAQQAEKKLALEAELQTRKPNEGINDDKWKDFAPIPKKEEEEELFPASGGKAKRERERKTKQFVELENRYIEPERTRGGARGGRGGPRGDSSARGARGDSGGRGARGDSAGRGRGRGAPRGEFRGAPRGEFRGGRGGRGQDSQPLNPSDQDAFPSLGGK